MQKPPLVSIDILLARTAQRAEIQELIALRLLTAGQEIKLPSWCYDEDVDPGERRREEIGQRRKIFNENYSGPNF